MSDDDLRIVPLKPNDTDNEEDATEAIPELLYQMRMLYLDLMSDDEEELDSDTIRLSYLFQNELKHCLFDCGSPIDEIVHIFLENIFDIEKPPEGESWFECFTDDDMRINALKFLNILQHSVSAHLLGTVKQLTKKDSVDEEE